MKTFSTIMKILAALAAIAGIVYVIATYGNQIAAWAKRLLDKIYSYFGYNEKVVIFSTAGQEEAAQAEEADFEG